jgi:hypothetical protein
MPEERSQEQVVLSREELHALVRSTVEETLTSIGLDHKNPIELQKDFKSLREWREAMQEVRNKTLLTVIGILVMGLAAAIWIGLKSMFSS